MWLHRASRHEHTRPVGQNHTQGSRHVMCSNISRNEARHIRASKLRNDNARAPAAHLWSQVTLDKQFVLLGVLASNHDEVVPRDHPVELLKPHRLSRHRHTLAAATVLPTTLGRFHLPVWRKRSRTRNEHRCHRKELAPAIVTCARTFLQRPTLPHCVGWCAFPWRWHFSWSQSTWRRRVKLLSQLPPRYSKPERLTLRRSLEQKVRHSPGR